MRIIKRSGEEQEFNPQKISVAIGKANGSVTKDKQFPENYVDTLNPREYAELYTHVKISKKYIDYLKTFA